MYPQGGILLAKEPTKIGSLILDSISRMGFGERLYKQNAVLNWPKIVGDIIAAETEAQRIDGDTLIIKVHRPAWRQQLTFLKADLLAKINLQIGEGHIKDIRFI